MVRRVSSGRKRKSGGGTKQSSRRRRPAATRSAPAAATTSPSLRASGRAIARHARQPVLTATPQSTTDVPLLVLRKDANRQRQLAIENVRHLGRFLSETLVASANALLMASQEWALALRDAIQAHAPAFVDTVMNVLSAVKVELARAADSTAVQQILAYLAYSMETAACLFAKAIGVVTFAVGRIVFNVKDVVTGSNGPLRAAKLRFSILRKRYVIDDPTLERVKATWARFHHLVIDTHVKPIASQVLTQVQMTLTVMWTGVINFWQQCKTERAYPYAIVADIDKFYRKTLEAIPKDSDEWRSLTWTVLQRAQEEAIALIQAGIELMSDLFQAVLKTEASWWRRKWRTVLAGAAATVGSYWLLGKLFSTSAVAPLADTVALPPPPSVDTGRPWWQYALLGGAGLAFAGRGAYKIAKYMENQKGVTVRINQEGESVVAPLLPANELQPLSEEEEIRREATTKLALTTGDGMPPLPPRRSARLAGVVTSSGIASSSASERVSI